jgi:predicted exporter
MGILGPILWIGWTSWLLYCAWKVVRQVRETVYFPVALSIFWYAFVLLVPFSYNGMAPYQNYIMNAYLWLLIGVLFRLPQLARNQQALRRPVQVPNLRTATAYAAGV